MIRLPLIVLALAWWATAILPVLASALEDQDRAGAYRFREPITITEGYASAELDVVSGEQGRATVRVSYQVVL